MDQDVRTRGTLNATKMELSVVRTNGPRVVVQKESPLDDKSQSLTPTDSKNGPKEAPKYGSRNDSNDPKDSSGSPSMSSDDAKVSPSNGTATPNTTAPPSKTSRKSASQQKAASIAARPVPLFAHFPDATEEATSQFQVIADCLYGAKHMGSSDHDAFECDCSEEWQGGLNQACGEDSDCINRATKMECVDGDCNCGEGCQNQRFQRKQYASVSVIKTEKKGFGLRTDSDLQPNDFIFEYIGEVINEPTFRRRMLQYDGEGIKHFYFMSLTKNEFVDATRKGNLGRFCNHSCNPNCYVDKWVVGKKLRMGIFATRTIRAGEELVFDYNVDRYGAEPQPCYCGEPNCTGFIGGKTQTERATKLPQATIEALGIDDPDSWDTAVAKRPRRKRTAEDDEEYVGSFEQSSLAEDGVTKVMAALMQCKEKWIAVKLLARIQSARDDERVINRVVRMHGYQILRSLLATFQDDENVVLQVLDILYKLPRLTKNKISDSNIETLIQTLSLSDHEAVASEARRLLEEWSKLETAYRIPRKKVDPNAPPTSVFEGRRGRDASDEAATSHDHDAATRQSKPAPLSSSFDGVAVPRGPRSNVPQRNPNFHNAPPRNWRGGQKPNFAGAGGGGGGGLPSGWFSATDPNGIVYYYTKTNLTTWKRPTQPADMLAGNPKVPSKAQQEKNAVQEIIDSLTKETPRPSAMQTPQPVGTPVAEPKKEKWRSLPIEKQMKIYENTLFPHIKSVTDRFRHRLPKEEIKKFGKEIGKKLVASDYKNNRVEDPNSITARQKKKVKTFVQEFFERAATKYKEQERRKNDREARQTNTTHRPKESASHGHTSPAAQAPATGEDSASRSRAPAAKGLSQEADASGHDEEEGESFDDGMMMMSDGENDNDDDEGPIATPAEDEGGPIATPPLSAESELLDDKHAKRKRTDSGPLSPSLTPSDLPSMKRKRFKDEDKPAAAAAAADTPTPPPPPPPPPPEEQQHEQHEQHEQQQRMREQEEEALIQENEEAQRLEDEAVARRQEQGGPSLLSSSSAMAVEGTAPELASLVSSMQAISRITRAIPQAVNGSGNEDGQR